MRTQDGRMGVDGVGKGLGRVVHRSADALEREANKKAGGAAPTGPAAVQTDAAAGAAAVTDKPVRSTPRAAAAISGGKAGAANVGKPITERIRNKTADAAPEKKAEVETKINDASAQAELRIEAAYDDAVDGTAGDEGDEGRADKLARGIKAIADMDATDRLITAEALDEERLRTRDAENELLRGRIRSGADGENEIDFSGMTADERALLFQTAADGQALIDEELEVVTGESDPVKQGVLAPNVVKVADLDLDADGTADGAEAVSGADTADDTSDDLTQQAVDDRIVDLWAERERLTDLQDQIALTFTDAELAKLSTGGTLSVTPTDGTPIGFEIDEEAVTAIRTTRDNQVADVETGEPTGVEVRTTSVALEDKPEGAFGAPGEANSDVTTAPVTGEAPDGAGDAEVSRNPDGTFTVGGDTGVVIPVEAWERVGDEYFPMTATVVVNDPELGAYTATIINSIDLDSPFSISDTGEAPEDHVDPNNRPRAGRIPQAETDRANAAQGPDFDPAAQSIDDTATIPVVVDSESGEVFVGDGTIEGGVPQWEAGPDSSSAVVTVNSPTLGTYTTTISNGVGVAGLYIAGTPRTSADPALPVADEIAQETTDEAVAAQQAEIDRRNADLPEDKQLPAFDPAAQNLDDSATIPVVAVTPEGGGASTYFVGDGTLEAPPVWPDTGESGVGSTQVTVHSPTLGTYQTTITFDTWSALNGASTYSISDSKQTEVTRAKADEELAEAAAAPEGTDSTDPVEPPAGTDPVADPTAAGDGAPISGEYDPEGGTTTVTIGDGRGTISDDDLLPTGDLDTFVGNVLIESPSGGSYTAQVQVVDGYDDAGEYTGTTYSIIDTDLDGSMLPELPASDEEDQNVDEGGAAGGPDGEEYFPDDTSNYDSGSGSGSGGGSGGGGYGSYGGGGAVGDASEALGEMAPAAPFAPVGSGETLTPVNVIAPTTPGGAGSTVLNVKGTEVTLADDAFAPQPGTDAAYASVQVAGQTLLIARMGAGTAEDPYTYELLDPAASPAPQGVDFQSIMDLITKFAEEKKRAEAAAAGTLTTPGTIQAGSGQAQLGPVLPGQPTGALTNSIVGLPINVEATANVG